MQHHLCNIFIIEYVRRNSNLSKNIKKKGCNKFGTEIVFWDTNNMKNRKVRDFTRFSVYNMTYFNKQMLKESFFIIIVLKNETIFLNSLS